MTQLKIYNLDDIGDSNPVCTLPKGEHVVGRGPTLNITDKRVSRSHAQIMVTDHGASIKSIHINPCFFKSSAGRNIQILNMNDIIKIGDGDTFSLLADKYWYRVRVELEQANDDKPIEKSDHLLNTTKRCIDDSSQGPSKRKKSDDNSSVHVSLSSPNHPQKPVTTETAEVPLSPDFCESLNFEFIDEMVAPQGSATTNNATPDNLRPIEEVTHEETSRKHISDDKKLSSCVPSLIHSSPIEIADIIDRPASPIEVEINPSTSNSHNKQNAFILHDDCSSDPKRKEQLLAPNDAPDLIRMGYVLDITNDEEQTRTIDGADDPKVKEELSVSNESPEITWSMDETADIKDVELQAQAAEESKVKADNDKVKEEAKNEEVVVVNADTGGDQGAGTSNTNTTPSTSRRERCWYGASCYRKNMQHRSDFSHPGDTDYNSDPNDNRPECPYGTTCYRHNRDHRMQYKHSKKPAPKPSKVNFQVTIGGCPHCSHCRGQKSDYESDVDSDYDL